MLNHISRRSFLKASAAAAAVGGSALAASGCGSSSGNGKSKLRMTWYGGDERHKVYNKVCDLYQKRNPGVTIAREPAEWGAYWERLATQAAGRDEPDVMHFTNMQLREFAGVLEDLGPYVKNGTLDMSGFQDELVDSGSVDNTYSAAPVGFLILCTLANRTKLAEAGIELPELDGEWTWEEFRRLGRRAADRLPSDAWFTTDLGGSARVFNSYVRGRGKLLFDTDANKLGFERADLIAWLQYWQEMRKLGIVPPADVAAEDGGKPFEDQMFAKGKLGLYPHTSNMLTNYQPFLSDDLVLRRLPVEEPGVTGTDYFFSVGMGVSARSEHKEEAVKLVDFFLNNKEANRIYSAEFGTPGSAEIRALAHKHAGSAEKQLLDFTQHMLDAGIVPDQMWPRGAVVINDSLMSRANERVGFGEASIEKAADMFFTEAANAMR